MEPYIKQPESEAEKIRKALEEFGKVCYQYKKYETSKYFRMFVAVTNVDVGVTREVEKLGISLKEIIEFIDAVKKDKDPGDTPKGLDPNEFIVGCKNVEDVLRKFATKFYFPKALKFLQMLVSGFGANKISKEAAVNQNDWQDNMHALMSLVVFAETVSPLRLLSKTGVT